MTKIRPGTHCTIDIWSGKPVTVEYEDWGNKEVKYFVFTPKDTEENVRVYITEADYVSWFGQNNGGDRQIEIHDKWFFGSLGRIEDQWTHVVASPGSPDGMYTSRFRWPRRYDWDAEDNRNFGGSTMHKIMRRKLKDSRVDNKGDD